MPLPTALPGFLYSKVLVLTDKMELRSLFVIDRTRAPPACIPFVPVLKDK